jgi:hypothetical protein
MVPVFAVFLLLQPALAEEDAADRQLFGSWRLVSFQLKIIGEEGAPAEPFGSHPFGRIILTSEHHMMVFICKSDRKPTFESGGGGGASILHDGLHREV